MSEESIVLGGGCFWCVEGALKEVEGVTETTCGYAGGQTDNPTYREVCKGDTGHAEVVKAVFNNSKISLEDLLRKFFKIHNPATLDKEGPDVGSQYRSIILTTSEEHKKKVEKLIESEISDNYSEEIVTEVKALENFHVAEEKHQDYFEKNPDSQYCKVHIPKKIEKIID